MEDVDWTLNGGGGGGGSVREFDLAVLSCRRRARGVSRSSCPGGGPSSLGRGWTLRILRTPKRPRFGDGCSVAMLSQDTVGLTSRADQVTTVCRCSAGR